MCQIGQDLNSPWTKQEVNTRQTGNRVGKSPKQRPDKQQIVCQPEQGIQLLDCETGQWSSTEVQNQGIERILAEKGDLGDMNRIDAIFQLKEGKGVWGLKS